LHNLASVISYFELKHAMRKGPNPLRNGPLESNAFPRIICRVAMVRE